MPRQIDDIGAEGAHYECDHCKRRERLQPTPFGTIDDSARVLGYRISGPEEDAKVYCPECTGLDEDYWDRKTLDMADAAGIAAGSAAWNEAP